MEVPTRKNRTRNLFTSSCYASENATKDLNPFHATDLFLYPLKTLENLWFYDVFRGCRKRSGARSELWFFKVMVTYIYERK